MNIENIVPQLRTTDLDRAIHFYTKTIGLTLSFRYQDFYAGLASGDRTIHLKLVDDPEPNIDFVRDGQHLHLHIGVGDIRAAFERVERAGAHHLFRQRPRRRRRRRRRRRSGSLFRYPEPPVLTI